MFSELETFVRHHGLKAALDALEIICLRNEGEARTTSRTLADQWARAAGRLHNLALLTRV